MTRSVAGRVCSLLALSVLLVGLIAVVSPARAEAAYIGWFVYVRNGSNDNGTLMWKWTIDDFPPRVFGFSSGRFWQRPERQHQRLVAGGVVFDQGALEQVRRGYQRKGLAPFK